MNIVPFKKMDFAVGQTSFFSEWKRLASIFLLACVYSWPHIASAAIPAATSIISNQATATYNDATNTQRTSTSNTVQTTVAQVKSFLLQQTQGKTASSSQQVCYPHTITNTGNGTDTYTLMPPMTGGGFIHTNVQYFPDVDGNGVPDNAVPIVMPQLIIMGGQFKFVVCADVPGALVNGATGTITVSVQDTRGVMFQQNNVDTTTISTSSINVTKTLTNMAPNGASVNSGPSPSIPLFVVLKYTNSGSQAATNLQLTDALPIGMVYALGSGVWSGSGAALTDANDAEAGSPGILYQAAGGMVTAVIANVPAGQSGHVYFGITIPPGRPVTDTSNIAQTTNMAFFQTTQDPVSKPTNAVTYSVVQNASVVANNTSASATNGVADNTVSPRTAVSPVGSVLMSASPGQTIIFENFIWNTGNGADSFDITLLNTGSCAPGSVIADACTFPTGTTFAVFKDDGIQSIVDTNGNDIPDTGNILPNDFAKVVVKATLPANAAAGNNGANGFRVVKQAKSFVNSIAVDNVTDRLDSIVANTVDLTSGASRCDSMPAGNASDGAGSAACVAAGNTSATTGFAGTTGSAASPINTNVVTPATAANTVTRFRLFVNNTALAADSYSLASSAAPAGWSVVFRLDGGVGDCSTVGITVSSTGVIAAGANRLICAEITVPGTVTGNAAPNNYPFTFTVTSNAVGSVVDSVVDRVTVNPLHSVTLTPNGIQLGIPGGSVTYFHNITNNGNVAEPIAFFSPFLTNDQAMFIATAFLDSNNSGSLDAGDMTIVASTLAMPTVTLGPAGSATSTRNIFVVVQVPLTANSMTPPNTTTITATYFMPGTTAQATDVTTVSDGLLLEKYQQTTACNMTPVTMLNMGVPNAPWSKNAIPASAATEPGDCIAYLVVITNKSASPLTAITVSDTLPAAGPVKISTSCGAPSATAPGTAPMGAINDGATGTLTTTAATLISGGFFTLQFCVKINDM